MNHLSNAGEEIKRDSLSSGERKGRSPNRRERGCRTATRKKKAAAQENRMERRDEEREIRVTGAQADFRRNPEYGGARETPPESGSTTIQG